MKTRVKSASIAILINEKNEILFHLRDNKPEIRYPNHWGLIGGGIKERESELEAIKREIKEEINLEIKEVQKIGEFDEFERYEQKIYVFLGRIDKKIGKIKLNEGQRLGFFDFDKITDLKMPPPLKHFLIENKEKILAY